MASTSTQPGAEARTLAREALARQANQKEHELAPLVELLRHRDLRRVVEIGTERGGTFYAWCHVARPDALVVSIDLPGGPFGGGYREDELETLRSYGRPGQQLHFLRRDSHDPATVETLRELLGGEGIDFLFIDGDHTLYGVRRDFELYAPLVARDGLIAFHDVLPHPEMPECKVDLLWRTVREHYEHVEFLDPDEERGWGQWGGIGVLFNESRTRRDGSEMLPRPELAGEWIAALDRDVRDSRAFAASREARAREQQARGRELDETLAASDAWRELAERRERERDEARRAVAEAVTIAENELRPRLDELEAYIETLHATRGWRALETYRRAVTAFRQGKPVRPWRPGTRVLADATVGGLPRAPAEPGRRERLVGAAGRDIVFRKAERPRVSIVVPAFNNVAVTLQCLASVARNTPHELIEVVVVDDVSTDSTPEALAQTTGVTVVRNEHNLGFLQTCNRGAAEASGEFVLFLNNDVEVGPAWLETLLETADAAPDVGAVGSKLVYPDGTLQEAGAFVWSDGSAWNFGRGGDPEAPEFNYRREVDYCSGAALLVRRELFERLGGFDVRYAPIYYEETDLCFGLRAEGYRVLYEPRSVVVHHEGMTHGTDDKPGVGGSRHTKTSQYRNRHIFANKWRDALARQRPPGTRAGHLGGRVDRRARVLVVDTWVPAHDHDSGSLRMTWILRLLRELGCAVTLFTTDRERREPYTAEFQQSGIEVHYGSQSFAEFANARRDEYDVVVLSRPYVAQPLLDDVGRCFPLATVVYDMIDVHFLREGRKAALLGGVSERELARLRDDELTCVRRSDITAAVSEEEAALVREQVPSARVVVLPNVHTIPEDRGPPFAERRDLLFIGGFRHDPNVDGIAWFVREVLPLVRERIDAHLWVLGSHPPDEVRALASPEVHVTGYRQDVDADFRRARVFVAPLRYGAGVKGKIGHAFSFGLPVVTTAIGAEGMDLEDGRHALVRETPEDFARAVVELYTDEELWRSLSTRSVEIVRDRWAPAAMRARLESLIEEAVSAPLADLALSRPFGARARERR